MKQFILALGFSLTLLFLIFGLKVTVIKAAPPELCAPSSPNYCSNPGGVIGRECQASCGCTYRAILCGGNSCSFSTIETNCDKAPTACNRACGGNSDIDKIFGQIIPPVPVQNLGFGSTGIGNFLSKIITIIYSVIGIIFVFMIIISAAQWIISGGDKEAVSKARGRITWAIIGIVVLSLTFVFLRILESITGFTFFGL